MRSIAIKQILCGVLLKIMVFINWIVMVISPAIFIRMGLSFQCLKIVTVCFGWESMEKDCIRLIEKRKVGIGISITGDFSIRCITEDKHKICMQLF